MIVDKSEAKEEFPIYGLDFPFESGLNHSNMVEKYFRGKMPTDYEKQETLKKYYPILYKKFENSSKEKSKLVKFLELFKLN